MPQKIAHKSPTLANAAPRSLELLTSQTLLLEALICRGLQSQRLDEIATIFFGY